MSRKITFNKISIEGFGSFVEPSTFFLNKPGITLIHGGNGNGKTTVFSALLWVLFNQNLKDIPTSKVPSWEWLRNEDWRGTRVSVNLDVGEDNYFIIRHLNFKGTTLKVVGKDSLMIVKNGSLVGEEHYKKDQALYIEHLLGMSSTVFKNSVLFGQRVKRLVEASNDEKRNLLEEVFETEWLSQAKERAAEEKDRATKDLSLLQIQKDKLATEYTSLKEKIEEYTTLIATFEKNKAEELAHKENKLEEAWVELAAVVVKWRELEDTRIIYRRAIWASKYLWQTETEKVVKTLEQQKELLYDRCKYLDLELSKTYDKILDATTNLQKVGTVCVTCGQKLNKKKVEEQLLKLQTEKEEQESLRRTIATEEAEVRIQLSKITENIKELLATSKTTELEKELNAFIYQNDFWNVERNMQRLEDKVAGIKEAIEEINKRVLPVINLDADKEKLFMLRADTLETIAKIEEKEEYIKLVSFWVTTGFGASGLKAYIQNAMLTSLNELVKNYADRFGVAVKFEVDLSKSNKTFRTLCEKEGHEVDYKELSGGQKQRVDLALAFAMEDLTTFKSDININLLDEIFEGLDSEGTELAFELIRFKLKQKSHKSIFVISHRPDLDTLNAKSIYINQVAGISYLDNKE